MTNVKIANLLFKTQYVCVRLCEHACLRALTFTDKAFLKKKPPEFRLDSR